jgi:DMSO/TMAO reductase YedYZ molybdopterin-dependent catalytic subunit
MRSATPEVDPAARTVSAAPSPRWAGPVATICAALAGVSTGTFLGAVFDTTSPFQAVGAAFIDRTPSWLRTWAIDVFGNDDKTALRVGMLIVIVALAALIGTQFTRRWSLVARAVAAFGVFGTIVAANRPNGGGASLLVGALGVAAALGVLVGARRWIVGTAERPGLQRRSGWDRRQFVTATAAVSGAAALAALAGRRIERQALDDARAQAPDTLPPLPEDVPDVGGVDIPPGAQLSPITPFITPNDDFYLIDTALSVPRINVDRWTLTIDGMVDERRTLRFDELLAMPQIERVVTIACVSNEVGGDLIGTAVWQGVRLDEVLASVGVQPAAEQVFSTSVDGWTCGFPVSAATDGRDAMIAIGMNGVALPPEHGFPARLIVPGLYGYVSATKWLERITLTTWADDVGYWVPRGWAREAPIKTQSRIDVPRRDDPVRVGTVTIAGIAWAQQRGVLRVEVGVDGEWADATLGSDVSEDTWRQWSFDWDATPGEHVIQVRATDGDGVTQTEDVARPDPDGATGWHTRRISVS